MTGTLRFILGDQLSPKISSLADADKRRDVVFLCEVQEEATYVRHHKQKIAFLFSAMRHFAEELRDAGFEVDYVRLDQRGNRGSFTQELARAMKRHKPGRVVVTEPGEWRVFQMMQGWEEALDVPVEIRDDTRFFASRANFEAHARGRKSLRMEFFYREMRRAHDILMDGDQPVGGKWNFDAENRKPLSGALILPKPLRVAPDAITREVLDLVAQRFADHFGDLEPFGWAVTREDALRALDRFIEEALPCFGDFQDAMAAGADFVYHAAISPYLNAGLLEPREICRQAEQAFVDGAAPLNAVEGFIRQILGWREYVRGIYWRGMPAYAETNALDAKRKLPDFYWTGETDMNCVASVVDATRRNAYAHHIQRLMITGNFALLAGIAPAQIEEWYLIVYADAYDWVELPNVHGMVMFADGGLLGSKPYAASGAYINRMSDYCADCHYDVKAKSGEKACPFNYLYWNFLIENEARLSGNPRLAMPYRSLRKMNAERQKEIVADSRRFLSSLRSSY